MSQGFSEAPDLEFEYSDADKWTVELSGESALALCNNIANHKQTADNNNMLFSYMKRCL